MEIGPITAVRGVAIIQPSAGAPDLSRVYEVEYLGQSGEDQYTPANRNPARGLEDEEGDAAEETAPPEAQARSDADSRKISFFA